MRLHYTLIAPLVLAALSACTAAQDKSPDAKPAQKPAPADPMEGFSRMVGGDWKMMAQSGTSMFDTWHWGPAQRSMRVMTEGSDAAGNPWRELQVYYWHPGRKQICLLGLSPFANGVSDGTIKFDGRTADAAFDLYQSGRLRKMGLRWAFEGPDKYHETLLEATGPDGLKPMNAWDHVRSKTRRTMPVRTGEEAPKPSERLKALEPLLGHTWDVKAQVTGDWGGGAGDAFHMETTFQWVPLANAIYARSVALRGNGTPTHVLDAYIYHHTGTGRLRCLALLNLGARGGGVYEGDVTVLDGGALQFDLKGCEGDQVVPCVVRLDFEKDGSLHQRVWSADGGPGAGEERAPTLDIHHTASEMSKSIIVVFQDKKNNYWFGSDVQGVYRYDGTTITHYSTEDGLCDNRVRGIQEDKSGNLYFTTSNGISKFDGRTFSTLIPVKSNPPDKEWKLDPDDLWFPGGQDAGVVCRYDGKVLHGLEFPKTKLGDEHYAQFPRSQYPNIRSSPYDVYSIFKDSKGSIWFGTGTGAGMLGVCRYDGKSFTWISSDEMGFGDLAYCIRATVEDKDGKFWFSNTLNRFDVFPHDPAGQAEGPVNFRKEKGIGHSEDLFAYFMSGTRDNNGDLWMATFGAGVWRYDGEHMTHYPVQDGDEPVTMFSVYKDNQGVLWLGTHQAGAYKFNGKTFEPFKP